MRTLGMALLILLCACTEKPADTPVSVDDRSRPQVYAVNYPLAWIAQELAGNSAEVHFPLPGDIDPAFWEPAAEELAPWQEADLILLNGAGYASWLGKVSLRSKVMLDTSAAFAESLIALEGGPLHSHGPTGEHSHGALAFTVWLDLRQFTQQLDAVAAALVQLLPQQVEEIRARKAKVQEQLEQWDESLQSLGEQLARAPLLYSHPVYQYLDRRYQLNGVAVHWEPGQVPSPRDFAELDQILARHPARLMLWEDEPLAETRARLAQRGIEVVAYRPLGNRPAMGDFLSAMSANISALQTAVADSNKVVNEVPQ